MTSTLRCRSSWCRERPGAGDQVGPAGRHRGSLEHQFRPEGSRWLLGRVARPTRAWPTGLAIRARHWAGGVVSFDPCIPAVARSASGHGVELMSEISRVVVNGVEYEIGVAGDRRLLDWLREDLGLTGAKYGCGEAACGACSVMIDGALARACVVATGDVVGRSVTTIEGLARNGELHPVQHAFVHVDAMQCGFCTPGMVIAAVALLNVHPHPSDDEITHWMVPNLCRPARLGRRVAPASFLAHDQFGRDLLVSLRGDGVNTSLVHVDNPPETDRSLFCGMARTARSSFATRASTTTGPTCDRATCQPGSSSPQLGGILSHMRTRSRTGSRRTPRSGWPSDPAHPSWKLALSVFRSSVHVPSCSL
jgi:aerobic-type carbon monoxide dehydrogenase small subunit (CoxS/CutS family)